MLARINKIKGLGLVFSDFTWSVGTPDFKAVNLIYGWNGCGKTTLTRLFDQVASSETGPVEYELQDAAGTKVRHDEALGLPIRVFNQDYVLNNVRILESQANTISILLGEENKGLITQIYEDERLLNGDPGDPTRPGLIFELRGFEQKKRRKETENEKAFTEVAKTIGAALIGSSQASRNYRAPDAKRDFAKMTAPDVLLEDALKAHILSLRQQPLEPILKVDDAFIETEDGRRNGLKALTAAYAEAGRLCGLTVEAEVVDRLVARPDVAEWVEQGLAIHATHRSENCEYCGNPVSAARVAELARHFSEADRCLKSDIDTTVATLRRVYGAVDRLALPDAARLYEELRPRFEQISSGFAAEKTVLLESIAALATALQTKKQQTTEAVALEAKIEPRYVEALLVAANKSITSHNNKSGEFDRQQQAALAAIKTHYLSTIDLEGSGRQAEIIDLTSELKRRDQEVRAVQERIASARAEISSAHRACEQINEGLRSFLGRGELSFEPQLADAGDGPDEKSEIVGYQIMRRGQPAAHLSEGEKTAIAFVYFVVHLGDGQFSQSDGIVVIDDPISSLDSNSLYQAFSFLKNAVKACKQVFVLTHNFEFLKLLLNWRGRYQKHTGYFMITNHLVDQERRAALVQMDKELRTYESEYHYIFKRLKEMRAEQDGSIARAYPVPNMARKVWDSFLMFRVPNGLGSYAKMDVLKAAGVDSQKLDAIYKFTNDQSHVTGAGFDPALVPETQKALAGIFEVMEQVAPDHFRILDEATA